MLYISNLAYTLSLEFVMDYYLHIYTKMTKNGLQTS